MSQFTNTEKSGDCSGGFRISVEGLCGFILRQHPTNTAYHVESHTGISARTVECWLERRVKPSFPHAMIMACVYGPKFLAASLERPPKWLDDACRNQQMEELEAARADIDRKMQELECTG